MPMQIILSIIISLVVTVIAAFVFIPVLRRLKAGQSIREDGPVWHSGKEGTPTIGGVIFIAGIIASCVLMTVIIRPVRIYSHFAILAFALIFALIGFLDDYAKVKKKQNLGLKARHKFALQLLVAAGFIFMMYHFDRLSTAVYVPFVNVYFQVPIVAYIIFAAFVIVGTVNSVNITDGVDGLATGVTIPVTVAFIFIAILWGDLSAGVFAAAMLGGLIGFLIFNFYPAKVFMGDTGSLFLGGAVCALAFALDIPLLLITLGIVYFIETLSDIIQIGYFKLSKGKRVFKMAPIHHHFEMSGWSEYKVFTVFTLVSVIFAIISYFGIINRY